jgi:hypothetical protein
LGAAQAPWDVGPANLSLLSFTTTHPPLFTPPAFFHPRTMDGCQSARRRPAAPSRSARGATGRGACRRSQGAPPRAPRARCFPTCLPSFFLPAYPYSPSPREPPRSVGRHVAAHPARTAAPCGRREVILCGWASCAPRPAGWSSPTSGRTLGRQGGPPPEGASQAVCMGSGDRQQWVRRLLTVNSCIKVRLDLQVDMSPVVVKGPFFPRVVNPRYRIRGTNV